MGKFGKKFALGENTPVVQATNTILEGGQQDILIETNGYGLSNNQAEQIVQNGERRHGRVEQTTQTVESAPVMPQQMPTTAQPATLVTQQVPQQVVSTPSPSLEGRGDGLPIPYNEVLKNVGAKIPYSIYDRLERIKRQSERSGNKADKRNIGDLIAQAIKEFVEKYDVQ